MASRVANKFQVKYPAIGPKPRGHTTSPISSVPARHRGFNTAEHQPTRSRQAITPKDTILRAVVASTVVRRFGFDHRRGIWAQNVERVATSRRKEKHPETIVIRVADSLLCAHTKHVWTVASNISGIQQFVPSLEDLMAIVYVSLAYILRCMVRTLAVVQPC